MSKLIDFKNQSLNLDYLTFNLPNSRQRIEEFGLIFFKYGFNSKIYDDQIETTQPVFQDESLNYTLTFRLEKESWNKQTLLIQFSGINARFIYRLLKIEDFSLSELNCQDLRVGRIDINFIRINQAEDSTFMEFFDKSEETFKNRYKTGTTENRGNTLFLGTRKSDYSARIYSKDSALKFELEIKKLKAKDLGDLVLRNSLLEFERVVVKNFFNYFSKSLNLETCFTDWLNSFFRLSHIKPNQHLVASYMQKHFLTPTSEEKLQFYRFLQFLSFVRNYQGDKTILNCQTYTTVEFKLTDFMKAVSSTPNTYQRDKFLKFFEELQGLPPFRERFAEIKFRRLLFFPVMNTFQDTERGPWIIQISIAEQLLEDSYSFHFPPTFLYYSNKRDLKVKLSIILIIAQESSLEKIYPIQDFLSEFEKRNNSIKSKVKQNIHQQFQDLLKYKIIQNRFIVEFEIDGKIIRKHKDNIQLEDIHSAKYIYFYDNIPKFN